MADSEERYARMLWSWISEPADAAVQTLVAGLGYPEAAGVVMSGGQVPGHDFTARLAGFHPENLEAVMRQLGIQVLIPGDEQWPERLNHLTFPPHCLYARGAGLVGALLPRSVSIVGARASTDYGARVAADLAYGLAERRFTVVSGAAFGIDAAAHRGALSAEAPTVAVLACGVDRAYPAAHAPLLTAIAEQGVIVSESPPGFAPFKSRFLARNRLIAALTAGTVVVEASLRSGALNTARHARDLVRPLGAVPGPVTSMMSAGCHDLLRNKGATLVTDAAEVADLCGEIGADAADPPRAPDTAEDELSPEARRVLEVVGSRGSIEVSALVYRTGLAVPLVLAATSELVVSGHVIQLGDHSVRRNRPVASEGSGRPRRG